MQRKNYWGADIKLFTNNVIYRLIEDYKKWVTEQKQLLEKKRYETIIKPGRFIILPDCTFRQSKPAVVAFVS